jgi:hypothetical protein
VKVEYATDPDVAKVYTLTGQYTWNSGQSTATVTFKVSVVDKCFNDLTPLADKSISYTIMDSAINQSLKPSPATQFDCRYTLELLSITPALPSGLSSVLTYNYGGNPASTLYSNTDSPKLTIYQSSYDAQSAGTYTVQFKQ